MVTRYGMSDTLGPIVYGSEHNSDEVFLGRDFNPTRNYSEDTATVIDNEVKRLVNTAYDTAMEILKTNIDKLHFLAGYLMKNEVMDEAQFNAAMDGNPTIEELEQMRDDKRRKSDEENRAKAEADEAERLRREAEEKLNQADTDEIPKMKN